MDDKKVEEKKEEKNSYPTLLGDFQQKETTKLSLRAK